MKVFQIWATASHPKEKPTLEFLLKNLIHGDFSHSAMY